HAPSGTVVPFDDDDRRFRRYRFVLSAVTHYHAAVDLLLAGTLVLQRAAVAQKRWDAHAEGVATLVEALSEARFGGDPCRAVRIRAELTGDEAFDARQRVVSVGEWLSSVFIATDTSVRLAG